MPRRIKKRHSPRKLLIASVGVATMCYVGCDTMETSGNLIAPPNTVSSSTTSGGGEAGQGGIGGDGGAAGQAGGQAGQGGIGGQGQGGGGHNGNP